jgi:ABC-type glycerol-3-phosphate transport system substrate-binding protein
MKVYQNPERLYSATRNALGKLDIANGEFSRLLDWNQTDLDRSLLLNGNVKVISEGELSQTVTMLPQGDQPQLERPLPVVEQPSMAPDIESRPVPSAVGEDAPSDSSSAPEDFIDDPTLPESSSSASADAVETQAAEPSDAKTKFCISNVEYTDLGCEAHLIKLEPAASNPHSGQDIVWVGGVGITDSMIMSKIADYNRNTSHDIWVKVVDYADFRYNGSFETRNYSTKAMESMLAQVNSGVGPDVIIGAGETGEFDNNNTLSDLNAYVDGINGINRDEYFDNAFRAFETNGKLYQIPLGFATHALVGNPTLVDGKTEMNYHDFSSSSVFLDDDTKLLKGFSTETLLNILVEGETGTWINYATGEVSVDRSSLIDLLELLRFQKQSSSKLRYEFSEDFEVELDPFQFDGIGSVYEGSGAFCPGSINSLTEYAMAKVREQETRWYGYPGSAGCATLIESPMTAGIAAYSTQKEKAWEVIKYLLSADVQVDINSVPLMNSYFPRAMVPVNIEAFRKLNLMEKTDGRVTEYIYSDSDLVYELDVGSFDDLLAEYEAMLKEPFRRYIHDDEVLTIVREVADEYLEGQITVTDAADTIVKRIMKLYEG